MEKVTGLQHGLPVTTTQRGICRVRNMKEDGKDPWICLYMYLNVSFFDTVPEFVSLLRSPGIDSKPGQPYLTFRSARLHA
jgi:hypothetical protein